MSFPLLWGGAESLPLRHGLPEQPTQRLVECFDRRFASRERGEPTCRRQGRTREPNVGLSVGSGNRPLDTALFFMRFLAVNGAQERIGRLGPLLVQNQQVVFCRFLSVYHFGGSPATRHTRNPPA
jgi:hypothetical protein